MTTLKASLNNGTFVALTKEQELNDTDWISYIPSFKGTGATFVIDGASTNTQLVVSSGLIPIEGDAIVVKDGTSSTVVRGTIGTVTENTGTYTADISSLGLTDAPTVVCLDDLPRMFTSFEPLASRCLCLNTFITLDSSTTTQYVGKYTGELAFEAGDTVIPYPDGFGTDIDNATWDSVSFDALAIDTFPKRIQFNNDGTRLFMLGSGSMRLFQLNLTTPYDISPASMTYSGVNYNIDDIMFAQTAFRFNNDGTKLFLAGRISGTTDQIIQYDLSTAFDLSSMSYSEIVYPVTEGINQINCFTFNNDGSKVIIERGNRLRSYSLGAPYDITRVRYDGIDFLTSAQGNPREIEFDSSGTRLFILDDSERFLYQYSLTIPYELATITYNGVFFAFDDESFDANGITFSPDGTKMYMVTDFANNTNANDDTIYQYSINGSINSVETQAGAPITVSSVTQGTPTNQLVLSNAVYDKVNFSAETGIYSFDFNNDGSKLFIFYSASDTIKEYNLATAYDITTATDSGNLRTLPDTDFGTCARFSPDGFKMFALSQQTDVLYQYSLSVAFDLSGSTAILQEAGPLSVGAQEPEPQGFTFNNDGTKVYIVGYENNTVFQYTLATAYEVSTGSYDGVSLPVDFVGAPSGLAFTSSGSSLFIIGVDNNTVYRFDLLTPYDISTATYTNDSVLVRPQGSDTRDIQFLSSGAKMLITDSTTGISQYSVPELPVRTITVDYPTTGSAPNRLAVPDRSVEHTTVTADSWVGDQINTVYTAESPQNGRGIKYKFIMSKDSEVTEVQYVLSRQLS